MDFADPDFCRACVAPNLKNRSHLQLPQILEMSLYSIGVRGLLHSTDGHLLNDEIPSTSEKTRISKFVAGFEGETTIPRYVRRPRSPLRLCSERAAPCLSQHLSNQRWQD